MEEEYVHKEIKCSVFLETDRVIQNIIARYWKANSKEKRYYVQDISVETRALLSCLKYNLSDSDCLKCHYVLRNYLQEYKPASSLALGSRTYPKINRREGGTFVRAEARSEDAGVAEGELRQGRTTQPQAEQMASLPTRDYRIGSNIQGKNRRYIREEKRHNYKQTRREVYV